MNRFFSAVFAVIISFSAFAVAAQDISEGVVVAFDRKANVLVLKDKTIWSLEKLEAELPEGLKAGDRIEIRYDFNEDDGVKAIYSIKIVGA